MAGSGAAVTVNRSVLPYPGVAQPVFVSVAEKGWPGTTSMDTEHAGEPELTTHEPYTLYVVKDGSADVGYSP